MSSDAIISVEGLGKRYRLGSSHSNERYTALRDVVAAKAKSLFRRTNNSITNNGSPAETRDFWALKDVSFEVKQGEVLGIIGRNGAGKSTLLKILSRITEPTEGRIKIKGRVASLLEVGTGFHPELTGRENIYLNGAILGMHRAEIRAKFDEIVAFAEVEKFLDTPVKRYSSGMYVRLAFAVAAHLDPEILIVDEVLAVGDAEFQKKCLGKMRQVAEGHGRTVLFVSHNMAAVETLCGRGLQLEGGKVIGLGATRSIVQSYLTQGGSTVSTLKESVDLGEGLLISQFEFKPNPITSGDRVNFQIEFSTVGRDCRVTELAIIVSAALGVRVAVIDLRANGLPLVACPGDPRVILGTIPQLQLIEGEYDVGLYVVSSSFAGNLDDLLRFSVIQRPSVNGPAPYAASHRGFMDIQHSAEVITAAG